MDVPMCCRTGCVMAAPKMSSTTSPSQRSSAGALCPPEMHFVDLSTLKINRDMEITQMSYAVTMAGAEDVCRVTYLSRLLRYLW